jgi:hypothetical protein
MGQTQTPGYAKGGIMCLGGVRIPYRPVTPTVSSYSSSGRQYEPSSRSGQQEQFNGWYGTYQTGFGLKEGLIDKLDRCNDRKMCGKMPVIHTK